MPSYIGYKPQFDPISLQEYLTVPMMILEGRQKEADKIEQYQNEAEKYRAMMGDSPEAQSIWAAYDNALNNLGDNILNNKTGDLTRAAKKIGDSFRNIKYKAEEAYNKQKKYQDMLDKNPNLIGNAGTVMDYYGKDYTPTFVDSKDLATSIGGIVAPEASTRLPQYLGNQGGLDYYTTGIPEQEIRDNIAKAVKDIPDNNMSNGIKEYLDRIDYKNLTSEMQSKVLENIYKSALASSGVGMTTVDPLKQQQEKTAIESAKASAAYHWTQNRIAKESLPQEWDDVDEYAVTDTKSKRYKYRQRKDSSGRIFIERSPLVKNSKGKWIPEKGSDWWQPAPEYKRDGTSYKESIPGTGLYGGTSTVYPENNSSVSYTYDSNKDKMTTTVADSETVLDDLENYPEIDYNEEKQTREVSAVKNKLIAEGYEESQMQFRWDKKNKRVVAIATGSPKPKLSTKQAFDAWMQQQNSAQLPTIFGSASYNQ